MKRMTIALASAALTLWAGLALAQTSTMTASTTTSTSSDLRTGTTWTGSPSKWQPGGLVTADYLRNRKIYDTAGKEIGEVERVLLDPDAGRIEFIVLGRGGFLEMGEDRIVIPWQAFSIADKGLVLNVPTDKLNNAPRYRDKDIPTLSIQDNRQKVYDYYGLTPESAPGMGGTSGARKQPAAPAVKPAPDTSKNQ